VTKLPILSSRQTEKILFKLGFRRVRQKGSHVFYRHSDGRTTTVPSHKGKSLSRPLLRTILREINIDLNEFDRVLKSI